MGSTSVGSRIKIASGQDAVDGAFSTIYGGAMLTHFQVWAYQVARNTVGVGDDLDLRSSTASPTLRVSSMTIAGS